MTTPPLSVSTNIASPTSSLNSISYQYPSQSPISPPVDNFDVKINPNYCTQELFSPHMDCVAYVQDKFPSAPSSVEEFIVKWHQFQPQFQPPLKSHFLCPPTSYKSLQHKKMYSWLRSKADSLVSKVPQQNYKDKEGSCSSSIVGAKGIGKSTMMRAFTSFLPFLYSEIIPIYISYNNSLATESMVLKKSLMNVIKDILHSHHGFPKNEEGGDRLEISLEKHNKYVMLFVDELDQLYRIAKDDQVYSNSKTSLHDLAYLGNTRSGRIVTILCGSSALLSHLITCNIDIEDRPSFPLSQVVNLNGTKYLPWKLERSLPTDLDLIGTICPDYKDNLVSKRILAFFSGCTPRYVERLLQKDVDPTSIESLSSDENFGSSNTLRLENLRKVWFRILDALAKKNEELLTSLIVDQNLPFTAIGTINWETNLKSLSYDEVRILLEELQDKQVLNHLLHLTDRSYLMLSGVEHGAPCFVYPGTMMMLCKRKLHTNSISNLRISASTFFQDLFSM